MYISRAYSSSIVGPKMSNFSMVGWSPPPIYVSLGALEH